MMTDREVRKRFDKIVDEDDGGFPPVAGPDSGGGGGGHFPQWSKLTIAFLCGSIGTSVLIFTPMFFPVLALAGLVGFVFVATKRRWR